MNSEPAFPVSDCEAIGPRLAHDTSSLRELAQRWRQTSARNLRGEDLCPCHNDDPGPHMTAIQFEWAAREIERLREDIRELHSEARNAVAQRDECRERANAAEVEISRLKAALREIAEFDVGVRLVPVAACKEIAANALRGEINA